MKTSRLEAFSDGVLAIVITIMVLEFKAPEDLTFESLLHLTPIFLSYLFSFIFIGIYWNNHHHLFQITEKVNGKILWANLHLLFWLSLIPFATSWIGEKHIEQLPVAFYGFILLMSGIAFYILGKVIVKQHDEDFELKKITNSAFKPKVSIVIYILGIGLSFINPWISIFCYVVVTLIWTIPNREIENIVESK